MEGFTALYSTQFLFFAERGHISTARNKVMKRVKTEVLIVLKYILSTLLVWLWRAGKDADMTD